MNNFCYVLIEWYLMGCQATFQIKGVTLDQQYSYNWLKDAAPEFTTREVQQVPFYEPVP